MQPNPEKIVEIIDKMDMCDGGKRDIKSLFKDGLGIELKEKALVRDQTWEIIRDGNGIDLRCEYSTVLRIDKDGLTRFQSVGNNFGFPLDELERVKIREK